MLLHLHLLSFTLCWVALLLLLTCRDPFYIFFLLFVFVFSHFALFYSFIHSLSSPHSLSFFSATFSLLFFIFFSFSFHTGPNRSKLQDMLANLRDAEDLPSVQPSLAPPTRPSVPRLTEQEIGRLDEGNFPLILHRFVVIHGSVLNAVLWFFS